MQDSEQQLKATSNGIVKTAHQFQARNFRNHCSFHPHMAESLTKLY